jgi:hypothetical protein
MLINCGLYNMEDIYIFKEGMIPQEPRAKTSGKKENCKEHGLHMISETLKDRPYSSLESRHI